MLIMNSLKLDADAQQRTCDLPFVDPSDRTEIFFLDSLEKREILQLFMQ
jgi:hypothetical protein